MPVAIHCPNPECKCALSVKEESLGRRVRCTKCGQTFLAETPHDDERGTKTYLPESKRVPQQIGRFLVKERLGAGAFATVYRAVDPELERDVALKIPHQTTSEQPKRLERFIREAKAAARLQHPNIVPVYDAGKDGDTYFIASALIAGKTLARSIPKDGMKPRQAVRIVADLAEALAYAHAQGIVHRDVKPGNVVLDADGKPHLMDFGLASRATDGERLTEDGTIMGTPAYMAPEQASGQQDKVLAATDQYSLGAVFYELLTGQPPFSGPPEVLIYNAVHMMPAAPHTVRKAVPEELSNCCMRALAKKPRERYAGCQALAEELRAWLAGPKAPASNRVGSPKSRVYAAATAFVGIALVTGGLLWLRPWNRGAEEVKKPEFNPAAPSLPEMSSWLAPTKNSLKQGDFVTARDLLKRVPDDKRDWMHKLLTLQAEEGLEAGEMELPLPRAWTLRRDRPVVVMFNYQKVTQFDLATRAQLKEVVLKDLESSGFAQFNDDATRVAVEIAPIIIPAPAPGANEPRPLLIGIWDTETGARLKTIEIKLDPEAKQPWAKPVALSPDGAWLAIDVMGQLRIWNTESGVPIPNLSVELPRNNLPMLAFSSDGRRVAVVASEQDQSVLKVWNLPAGTLDRFPPRPVGFLLALAFSPDGKHLAIAGGGDGRLDKQKIEVQRFETVQRDVDDFVIENGQQVPKKRVEFSRVPVRVALEESVAQCEHEKRIQVLDSADGRALTTHDAAMPIRHLTWSGDNGRLNLVTTHPSDVAEVLTLDIASNTSKKVMTIPVTAGRIMTTDDGGVMLNEDKRRDHLYTWAARRSRLAGTWSDLRRPAAEMQFSADGSRLAAHLWEDDSRRVGSALLFSLDAVKPLIEANGVRRLESSAKLKWLALYGERGVPPARIFDGQSGEAFKGSKDIHGDMHILAVDAAGKRVVTTNSDDPRLGRYVSAKEGFQVPAMDIREKPKMAKPKAIDVQVRDFPSGAVLCDLAKFELIDRDHTIGFTPNGEHVYQIRERDEHGATHIVVWDAQSGVNCFDAPIKGYPPVFCKRGSYVVYFPVDDKGADGKVKEAVLQMWDYVAKMKRFETKYDGDPSQISLAATPDGGKLMAFQCTLGIVRIWDVNRGVEEFREHGLGVLCNDRFPVSILSPDGRWLALAKSNRPVTKFIIPNGPGLKKMPEQADGKAIESSDTAPAPIPGALDFALLLTLAQPGQEFPVEPWAGPPIQSIIILRDLRNGKTTFALTGINGTINNLAFSRDGRFIAAGSDNGKNKAGEVRVWKIATGEPVATFSAFNGPVRCIALSHDGAMVAAAGMDQSLKVWRVAAEPAK